MSSTRPDVPGMVRSYADASSPNRAAGSSSNVSSDAHATGRSSACAHSASRVDFPYPAGAVTATTGRWLVRAVRIREPRLTAPGRARGTEILASKSDRPTSAADDADPDASPNTTRDSSRTAMEARLRGRGQPNVHLNHAIWMTTTDRSASTIRRGERIDAPRSSPLVASDGRKEEETMASEIHRTNWTSARDDLLGSARSARDPSRDDDGSRTACPERRDRPSSSTTSSTSCTPSTRTSTASRERSTYAIRKGFLDVGVKDNTVLDLLGADGGRVGVPDRERRHGLFPRLHRPDVGADGRRDPSAWRWRLRRHVVGMDRRLRPAGPGSWRRRPVPARPARTTTAPLPDSGFHVGRSRTSTGAHARAVVPDGRRPGANRRHDQADDEDLPVHAGWHTARASRRSSRAARATRARLRRFPRPCSSREAARRSTRCPPSDFGFFELMDELVQGEPAREHRPRVDGAVGRDRDRQGSDRSSRTSGCDANARGGGRGRRRDVAGAVPQRPTVEGFGYYDDDSAWFNMLWVGGYTFETPPPMVTPEGIVPFPRDGFAEAARAHDVLLRGHRDHAGDVHAADGRRVAVPRGVQGCRRGRTSKAEEHYTVTLPPDIPAARFWSMTLYDNQTRSMLQTPQRFPRAGSQTYPTPAASRRGRIDDPHFAPATTGGLSRRELDPDRRRSAGASRSCACTARSSRSSTRAGRPSEIERVSP